MSFGYSRPHSTDSWRSRRPSFELSSRMHSVPRNLKSASRHTGGSYSSDFNFVESPLYYMHRSDSSTMSRESLSPRNTGRPYDREDFSAKYPHKNYDKELQRKMTFNLHEEIEKPFLTIILEEICDPDRINDICLNTLTSMMRSKTYRKFLHHMNNSAIPSSPQLYDITQSNKMPIPTKGYNNKKTNKDPKESGGQGTSALTQADAGSSKKVKIHPPRKSQVFNDLPTQFEEYRTQTLINRKRRQDEINALEKLKGKLPPVKKTHKPVNKSHTDVANAEEEVEVEGDADDPLAKRKFTNIINSMSTGKPSKVPQEEPEIPVQKEKIKMLSPEEILKTKWLRLTDEQVADLEAEIIASGKDPGIHHFSKVNLEDIFKKK